MTRTGVTDRLKLAVATAAKRCPALAKRHISPHTVRHATAMHLLQAGVDLSVVALWLGHESTATTHMYVEADLTMKERALKCPSEPQGIPPNRVNLPHGETEISDSIILTAVLSALTEPSVKRFSSATGASKNGLRP